MRICLVRLSALGDIVMCLPLIRTLQKNFPEAEITWVIGKPFYPLLEKLEGVRFIVLPKVKSWGDLRRARALLKPHFFDVLLATQASFSAHIIYSCISAKRKIGYDKFRSKDFHGFFIDERIEFHPEHTVEGFLRFAKTIGAKEMVFDGSIPLIEKSKIEKPYFVINPCSSKREKDWNYSNYAAIIRYVKEEFGMEAVLTGTTVDKSVCDQIEKGSPCINLCGKTSLQELGAILQSAKFVLSPDTGPAHIASGIGTPVIGLFAPTSPLLTGPYFSKEHLINKHPEVIARYAKSKQNWNVRIYHKEAMNLITIKDVQEKIRSLYE